jgi:rod shape-determining protein MreD
MREEIQVYRFSIAATLGVPLAALFLQSWIPLRLGFFSIFDLPLLTVIFFAVARRDPATGLLTGCAIGLLQDALTAQPVGLFGISKTVVGYAASSLGVRIDVENPITRGLMTVAFYLLQRLVYMAVANGMAAQDIAWRWGHDLGASLANGALAVVVFAMLDTFKQRS